jgi:hypothetical protein
MTLFALSIRRRVLCGMQLQRRHLKLQRHRHQRVARRLRQRTQQALFRRPQLRLLPKAEMLHHRQCLHKHLMHSRRRMLQKGGGHPSFRWWLHFSGAPSKYTASRAPLTSQQLQQQLVQQQPLLQPTVTWWQRKP